ncbi:MAG: hypothetical protein ABSC48_03825 [Terracidiphilus sp.]
MTLLLSTVIGKYNGILMAERTVFGAFSDNLFPLNSLHIAPKIVQNRVFFHSGQFRAFSASQAPNVSACFPETPERLERQTAATSGLANRCRPAQQHFSRRVPQ